jgi:hypothetical protein
MFPLSLRTTPYLCFLHSNNDTFNDIPPVRDLIDTTTYLRVLSLLYSHAFLLTLRVKRPGGECPPATFCLYAFLSFNEDWLHSCLLTSSPLLDYTAWGGGGETKPTIVVCIPIPASSSVHLCLDEGLISIQIKDTLRYRPQAI